MRSRSRATCGWSNLCISGRGGLVTSRPPRRQPSHHDKYNKSPANQPGQPSRAGCLRSAVRGRLRKVAAVGAGTRRLWNPVEDRPFLAISQYPALVNESATPDNVGKALTVQAEDHALTWPISTEGPRLSPFPIDDSEFGVAALYHIRHSAAIRAEANTPNSSYSFLSTPPTATNSVLPLFATNATRLLSGPKDQQYQ